MKWLRIGLCVMAVLLLAVAVFAAAEEVVIDVVDNEMRVLSYRVPLTDTETPITVDLADGEVVLLVSSPSGIVEINLGDVSIKTTEKASGRVAIQQTAEATATATSKPRGEKRCATCGSAARDHICPGCKTAYCVHDDIKCGYRLNPAPTRFSTKGPDGKTVSFYIAEDGSHMAGVPPQSKYEVWTPSKAYMDSRATPTPSPRVWMEPPAER